MLSMPASHVREHAREALVSLAPRTAERVDSEWRGQLADYVLGQQSGPEATATRGHLKRSEPARAWALSTVDSLGDLYGDGVEPEIPDGDSGRRGRGGREKAAGGAAAAGATAASGSKPASSKPKPTARSKPPERSSTREGSSRPEPARTRPGSDGTAGRPLSPEAQAAVRRRRVLGAIAGVAGLVALVLFATLVWPFDGDDDEPATPAADSPAPGPADPASQEAELLAQIELQPVGNAKGGGIAYIAQQGDQRQLIVQARLEPSTEQEAYEVWLYNSDQDAMSIGGQFTDEEGLFVAAGVLPENFEDFEFIDVSRERIDQNPEHSGESVLRGQIAGGQATPEAGGAAPPGTEPPPAGGAIPPDGGALPPDGGALPPGGGAVPPGGGAVPPGGEVVPPESGAPAPGGGAQPPSGGGGSGGSSGGGGRNGGGGGGN